MSGHLSPEVLARVAEHGGAVLAAPQRRHFRACLRCQDAVIEAAETGREFGRSPAAEAPPPDVVEAIIGRTTTAGARGRRRYFAALVPLAAALVFMVVSPRLREPTVPAEWTRPIAEVLASRGPGSLVFPGAEATLGEAPLRRGGEADEAVVASIAALAAAYHDGPDDPEVATWLVGGYLALDDLAAAHSFATDGLRRHPDHGRLLAVAGIVAHRRGDSRRAREMFEAALAGGHDSPTVRLDLAIVQLDAGQREAGLTTLRELAHGGSPAIARHARALLAAHDRH